MANLNYLKVISTLILLFFIASSCGTTKKMALSCPDPASHYISNTFLNHPRHNVIPYTVTHRESKRSYSFSKHAHQSNTSQIKPIKIKDEPNKLQENSTSTQSEIMVVPDQTEYNTNLYAALADSVIQVDGAYPPISIPKDEIEKLVAAVASLAKTQMQDSVYTPPETNKMAIAGFVSSLVGALLAFLFISGETFQLLIAGMVCVVGLVLSSIALRKIKKNPGKYKGKGKAIAGLVIGLLPLILGIVFIIAYVVSGGG